VNAEMTDRKEFAGWVFYDGRCGLCTGSVRRFGRLLRRHHFALAPLQAPWVIKRLALTHDELLLEMRLLTRDGDLLGGADALMAIARQIWWLRPVAWLARIPLARVWMRKAYRQLALRRYCLGGACVAEGEAERIPRGVHGPRRKTPRARRRRGIVFFDLP
jgi:predicted DCC family thiol-disulfide oxidoreductase YuxK